MTDRESLLAACLDQPADDTARLVYADYLREQGNTATQAIGRFIWAGVTLATFRGNEPVGDGMFFDAQKELNTVATQVMGAQLKPIIGCDWGWDQTDSARPDLLTATVLPKYMPQPDSIRRSRRRVGGQYPGATYERGMLTGLRLTLKNWHLLAGNILTTCPLEFVEVLNVPGLTLRISLDGDKWKLTGELKLPATRAGQYPEPALTLTEIWSIGARDRFVHYVVTATTDVIELLRLEAGDRWPERAEAVS
jgi:uncharacterized protein (TIGR02996 family)